MGLASGMDLTSETRFGFGHTVRLRAFVWTFGKAFHVQECRRWMGSGTAVRKAGKKANRM